MWLLLLAQTHTTYNIYVFSRLSLFLFLFFPPQFPSITYAYIFKKPLKHFLFFFLIRDFFLTFFPLFFVLDIRKCTRYTMCKFIVLPFFCFKRVDVSLLFSVSLVCTDVLWFIVYGLVVTPAEDKVEV